MNRRFFSALCAVSSALPFALPAAADVAKEPLPAKAPPGPARVIQVLEEIETSLIEASDDPITRVNAKKGQYHFDCSGMASWVLRRAALGAWQKVRERSATGRLVARDFFRTIAGVAPGKPSWSWQRIERVRDAAPGDVIAWLKPQSTRITGHVGFVVEAPVPSRRMPGSYLVRFADSSRYQHQDDTREGTGRDGFGHGTILLLTDPESGAAAGYGWYGDFSSWVSQTEVVIGRPRR